MSNSNLSIAFYTKQGYSEEQAKEIISNLQRKRSKRCVEYYMSRGFNEEDAKEAVASFQSTTSKLAITKQAPSQLAFWTTRGLSIEDATIKIQKLQSRSKESYIERYGNDLGLEKYNNFVSVAKLSNNIDHFVTLYGEAGVSRWTDKYTNCKFQSKIANSILEKLYNYLYTSGIYTDNTKVFFKNDMLAKTEYSINHGSGVYFYDWVDCDNKIVIELHGDYWHANPRLYNKDDIIFDTTAGDIWTKDLEKSNLAERNGFCVFVVWLNKQTKINSPIESNIVNHLAYLIKQKLLII